MPIILKNQVVVKNKKPEPPAQSGLQEIRKTQAEQPKDTSNLIKPKYVEDKSVYYKTSDYLKDLLGEGN